MKHWVGLAAATVALSGCASFGQRGVPIPAVAAHQHLVSPAFSPIVQAPVMDAADLLAMLDEAGIRRGVVLSTGYSFADERKKISDAAAATVRENDWTSRQVTSSNGRLVGFCSVNPLTDEALGEIDRCLGLPGIVGLKLHFGNSGVSLRDRHDRQRMEQVFAAADARHAAIVVHLRSRGANQPGGTPYGAQDAQLFLDHLLPKAPDVVVQVAHLAGSGPGYSSEAHEVMQVFARAIAAHDPRTRNLYFDQATDASSETTPAEGAMIAEAIRGVGVERVFFGSDLPMPGSNGILSGNPRARESWQVFLAKVPLTKAEFATIARNVPAYMKSR